MGRKKRDTYVSRFLSQILVAEAVEILAAAEDVGLEQLRTWLLEHAAAVNAANPESFRYAW